MANSGITRASDLDRGVPERQSMGIVYARPANQERLTALVKAGTLHLRPHPDWTGDVTDWTADPYRDRNWQFQHHTLRWLNPLRWSAEDGDAASRDEWRRVARSWFDANVPASITKSPFAWKDMADGNRAIQLSLGVNLIDDDDDWYVDMLRAHVEWLVDESHLATKNHALHQHTGLIVAAATLRDRDALNVAYQRMVDQFGSTFDEHGANDEGSVGYHQLNLGWWSQAWARIEAEGLEIPEEVAARIDSGRAALAHLTLPNGKLPQIGDTARGRLKEGLGPYVEFVRTQGTDGEPPKGLAVAYERGYVVSRSGWGENRPLAEESHMLLRHGEDMRAHSHQDRGSVHIYAQGRPWLVDGGFHSYQRNDPTRNHFLSRDAHNIAHIPKKKHDDRLPVDLEKFAVDEHFHDAVVVDRGYADIEVRRRVIYLTAPDCWIIWDEASQPARLAQQWLADLRVAVRRQDRGFELQSGESSLTMSWIGSQPSLQAHKAVEGDLRGWISTRWKTLEPSTLITATSSVNRPRNIVVIAPSSPREFAIVKSYVTTAGRLDVTLMRGPQIWRVKVEGSEIDVADVKRSW